MKQKIKTLGPYILILFLVILMVGFNFYVSRVGATDYSETTVTVGNAAPVVSSISFASGDNVNLNEGATTTVTVRALVTDNNGCNDIQDGVATAKAYIYRSGVSGQASCSSDLDNCYLIASCSTDATRNACTGGSDTDLIYTCSTNLQYFAEPTDGTSSNSSEQWYGAIWAVDATGDDDIASNSTQVTDVVLLRALEASASINYSAVSAGTNTGASPIEMGVENTGNSGMDPLIAATTTLVCTAGACNTLTIANANQKYASVSQDYSDPYNVALSGTATNYNLELAKPDSTTYPVDDQIFWGLGVDSGQTVGSYAGVNTFTATGD